MKTQRGMSTVAVVIILMIIAVGIAIVVNVNKKEKRNDQSSEDGAALENDTASSTKRIQFNLMEQNQSGQYGIAVIDEVDGQARFTITLSGKASLVPQPAHVHVGTCDVLGEIASPLNDVVNGHSEKIYSLSFDGLVGHVLSFYPLSLKVHKSAEEPNVFVACGVLPNPYPKDENNASSNASTSVKVVETIDVRYTANGFLPVEVRIKKGQIVRFINETPNEFSVASNPHPVHTKFPQFDQSKSSLKGKTVFEFTFDKAGSWDYHNHLNSAHGGVVIVE